ncbi:MAG: CidA/LrgA family protein [Agathobacter sp.]|nr:CidA/LrgA family protein [Agathobacter sp.]
MKYLRQFLLILIFAFLGELLRFLIPLSIPGSIYGLVLLFIALMTGIVKLPQVKEASKFLIEIMPLVFIPAGVKLLTSWGVLQPILLPVAVITVVSTVVVMVVSGWVTQLVIRRGGGDCDRDCGKSKNQREEN